MRSTMFGLCLLAATGALGCARGSTDDLGDDLASIAEDGGPEGTSVTAPQGNGYDAGAPAKDGGAPAGDAGTDATTPGTCSSFTGSLVTFDLTKLSGSPSDVTPSAKATGVTVGALKRTGVTAVSTSGAFNASGWPTGAVDKSKYYGFSLTPPSGCTISLTKVSLSLDASNTGPKSASIGTSDDAYGTLRNATIGSATNVTLQGVTNVDGSVEVRLYGYSAEGSGGTMRIADTLSVTGALAPL